MPCGYDALIMPCVVWALSMSGCVLECWLTSQPLSGPNAVRLTPAVSKRKQVTARIGLSAQCICVAKFSRSGPGVTAARQQAVIDGWMNSRVHNSRLCA